VWWIYSHIVSILLFILLMVNSVYNVDQLDMNCPFYCFYTVDGQYFLYCWWSIVFILYQNYWPSTGNNRVIFYWCFGKIKKCSRGIREDMWICWPRHQDTHDITVLLPSCWVEQLIQFLILQYLFSIENQV
jgi:hypothetical protein